MHNITVEMYYYKCRYGGIDPDLSFASHTLDPKSVTIELEEHIHADHRIVMSNQSVVIRGQVQSWKGHDPNPLRKAGEKVKIDIGRYLEPPPSLYREEIENLHIGTSRFGSHGINTLLYLCKSILYINWKEYPFEYMKEHLAEMKALFDTIRTDTLLEEMDG